MDNRDRIHTQTARTCLQNTLAMDAELATDSTEMFRACIYTAQDIGRESGRLGHMHTVCVLAEQREHAAGKASTKFRSAPDINKFFQILARKEINTVSIA